MPYKGRKEGSQILNFHGSSQRPFTPLFDPLCHVVTPYAMSDYGAHARHVYILSLMQADHPEASS